MPDFPPPRSAASAFGADICFLCLTRLNDGTRTIEHVTPRWAQSRFELNQLELGLLNHTGLRYTQHTVPACRECNSKYLKPLEDALSEATTLGVEAVRNLDEQTLFWWGAKMFLGTLWAEARLKAERSLGANSEPIVSRHLLERFDLLHFFLRGVREPIVFSRGVPATIRVYRARVPPSQSSRWDYADNLEGMTVAVRMNDAFLLIALGDGGALKVLDGAFDECLNHGLDPLQAMELAAQFTYWARLLQDPPCFFVGRTRDYWCVDWRSSSEVSGFARLPFGAWDMAEYAKQLAAFIRSPVTDVFRPPNKVRSFLRAADGSLVHRPV